MFQESRDAVAAMGESPKSGVAMAPTPIAMDGGWGWVVVLGAFLAYFIADGWSYSFGIFYTDLLEYFHEGKGKTAVIAALLYGFPLLISPIICALVTSYGCRKIGVIGGFIYGVSFLFSAFATSVDVLCISVGVISSIGLSMAYVSSLVIVTHYFEKRRGLATGLAVTGSGLGAFAFPPLIEELSEIYAWRGTLLILGGIGFNIMVSGALFRAPPMMKAEVEEDLETGETELHPEDGEDIRTEPQPKRGMNRSDNKIPSHLQQSGGKLALKKQYSKSLENIDAGKFEGSLRNKQLQCSADGDSHEERRLLRDGAPVTRRPLEITVSSPELCKLNKMSHPNQKRASLSHEVQSTRHQSEASSHPSKVLTFWQELQMLVKSMMDISLIQNAPYLLFCASNFILYLWVGIPYVYLVDKALISGIDKKKAVFLMSIIGIARTVGQLVLGIIGDRKSINITALYAASISIVGLVTLLVPVFTVYGTLVMFSTIFGFFISVTYCLQMMVVVEIVGIAKATNAFGLVQLSQGIATLLGTPVAGKSFIPKCSDRYIVNAYE